MTKRFVVTAGRYGRHQVIPMRASRQPGWLPSHFALHIPHRSHGAMGRSARRCRAGVRNTTARETASPPGSLPSEWDGDAAAPGGYLLCCARKALLKSTSPTPSWWGAEGGWGSLGSTPSFPACYRKYQNLCRVFLPPHSKI